MLVRIMKIAILMSTYNGEKYLEEQISSILNQKTELEINLIVRDDGSTDNTISILEKYKKERLLSYSKEENVGAAKSFIKLLMDNKNYDFYAFADQDDYWDCDKIQKGYEAIKIFDKPALYCSNSKMVDADLNEIGRCVHREIPTYTKESILCLASCAQGCTTVFNNELAQIIQNNPMPNQFIMHDSLLTCLCALINGTIIYDDNPSMLYRIHGKNVFGMATRKQGIVKVLKSRFNEIVSKNNIGMIEQLQSIIYVYSKYIPIDNIKLSNNIIKCKKSILHRIKLIFNPKLKCDTLNKTITKKMAILLGNN